MRTAPRFPTDDRIARAFAAGRCPLPGPICPQGGQVPDWSSGQCKLCQLVQARHGQAERLARCGMKLILGNKNYSSWSLRGWLAVKQSGLLFEEITVPLFGEDWDARKKQHDEIAPSSGKVPVLWDGEAVVWDSLAIIEYLSDKVGRDRFWPKADDARAMARSMVAEMHSGYLALRHECPMNMRAKVEGLELSAAAKADVVRILTLWAEARARFGKGGPFLFGTYSAADIIYAPVVSRFITYGVGVPGFALTYMEAVWEHEWLQAWLQAAEAEEWVIEQYEMPAAKK